MRPGGGAPPTDRPVTLAHRLRSLVPARTGVPVLLLGSVAGQLAVLASTPVLSRLFTPDALGLFAVLSAVESILVAAAALRYDHAMAVAKDDDQAGRLFSLSLALAAGSGAITAAFLVTGIGDRPFGLPDLRPFALLLGLGLTLDAAYQTMTLWALRQRAFRRVAMAKASQGVGQAVGQIALGLAPGGTGGLLLGWVAGRVAGIAALVRAVPARAAARARPRTLWDAAVHNARFPSLALPAGILNSFALQVPSVLIAAAYDPRVAGLYFLASRVTGVPITLVSQTLSQAFLGRISPGAEGGTGPAMRAAIVRTVRRLAPLVGIPTVAVMAVGPVAFAAVFGAEWREAGRFAAALAPAFLAQVLAAPFVWALVASGRQTWQLGWDASRLALAVLALLVPSALGHSPLVAVSLYSAVMTVSYLALLGLVLVATRHDVAVPDASSGS